jgi:hypothetical protein
MKLYMFFRSVGNCRHKIISKGEIRINLPKESNCTRFCKINPSARTALKSYSNNNAYLIYLQLKNLNLHANLTTSDV